MGCAGGPGGLQGNRESLAVSACQILAGDRAPASRFWRTHFAHRSRELTPPKSALPGLNSGRELGRSERGNLARKSSPQLLKSCRRQLLDWPDSAPAIARRMSGSWCPNRAPVRAFPASSQRPIMFLMFGRGCRKPRGKQGFHTLPSARAIVLRRWTKWNLRRHRRRLLLAPDSAVDAGRVGYTCTTPKSTAISTRAIEKPHMMRNE